MEYRKFDNVIVARIDKDEEISEQLRVIAIKENIKLASVQALGASMISQSEYTRQTKRNIIQTASRGIMKLHH